MYSAQFHAYAHFVRHNPQQFQSGMGTESRDYSKLHSKYFNWYYELWAIIYNWVWSVHYVEYHVIRKIQCFKNVLRSFHCRASFFSISCPFIDFWCWGRSNYSWTGLKINSLASATNCLCAENNEECAIMVNRWHWTGLSCFNVWLMIVLWPPQTKVSFDVIVWNFCKLWQKYPKHICVSNSWFLKRWWTRPDKRKETEWARKLHYSSD